MSSEKCFASETLFLPSTLFYYASNIPLDQAVKFKRVIVEPENISQNELDYLKKKGIMIYAYLSIGEVGPDRPWASQLDKKWVLGENKNWQSTVMDMNHTGWHDFVLNYQAERLWLAGYEGFFLDTMDSYQQFTQSAVEVKSQQQGIITLIKAIRKKFLGVRLLFNRGFEVLDEVAYLSDGVVAESLFSGWDPKTSGYKNVNSADYQWLLKKLTHVRDHYTLPVTVIDYLPAGQTLRAEKLAKQILALGFVPYVSNVELNQVGIGIKARE